ncbi:MAG TPA: preprotein translocase subunit SecY, partial [Actinobacteria bacterium]|nr:preprotein translocase subunit SecY [Actinomycetota bacterium]
MVGRRMYGGTSTYIPLKVNMAGVIPVIFASSLLFLPILLVQLTGSQDGWALWVQQNLGTGTGNWYLAIYFALIVFFCYFYVS